MPAYNNTPFKAPPRLLVAGHPNYFFGGFDDKVAPTKMQVTSVAIASDVATLGVTVLEGNIPIVGSLVSVQGTQTATSGGAPNFNVSDVALSGVTINATTGIGTITFSLTSSDIATTADAGKAIVSAPETSEATAVEASVPVVPSFNETQTSDERTFTVVVSFPTAPTAWTANLQVALRDMDSEYVNVNSTTDFTWTNGTTTYLKQYTLQSGLFYRLKVATATGSGFVVAKIMP